ncbi:MAG: PAS domain-containing protein [Candidatus Omnitrophota bacterium]|nr:MAG: PAS domain-containing protein [Candidatus Omnitrophota bacterium]
MKIANKISLSFLATAAILTTIAGSIFYNMAENSLKKEIYEHLKTTAYSKADHIETLLREDKNRIALMIQTDLVELALSSVLYNEAASKGILKKLNSELNRLVEIDKEAYEILVMDRQGKVVASNNEGNIGLDKSAQACFREGKNKICIKDVHYFEETKEKGYTISGPVQDDETGEFLGVYVTRFRMDILNELLAERTGLGETGETYLVNKDGYMITPSRFIKGAVLRQKVDTESLRKHWFPMPERPGVHIEHEPVKVYLDYRGVEVLGVHRHIPQMQWTLSAEIDAKEALAPLLKIKVLFLIIILFVPIAAWLMGIFASGFIVKPIHMLGAGIRVIGKGNLDHKVGTDANDEIGELSRAFDKMTEDLKATTTSVDRLNQEAAERKKAQEGLRRSAEEWENTFNAVADLVFVQDTNFNIIRANKAFCDALKLKPDEVIGRKCYELLHNSDKPWPDCPFDKSRRDKKIHTEEINDPNLGFPVLVTTSPILNEKGQVVNMVQVVKDISDLKKVDKLKNEFISTVSHELRTPLSTIKEGVALVLDGVPGKVSPKQRKILKMSKDNIDRLARLIDDLLDISKIEAGKAELKKAVTDICGLLKNNYNKWKGQADERHQELQFVPCGRKINLFIDSDKIIQVMDNLISNAIKYTPEKGKIKIEIKDKKKEVEISVSDTGVGIARDDMSKLFGKFQQFERVAGPGLKGTGLGLAIARQLVMMHKGEIKAQSKPNKGSKFSFTLPKMKAGKNGKEKDTVHRG